MDKSQRVVDTHRPGGKDGGCQCKIVGISNDRWQYIYLEGIWKTSFCLEVVAQCVVHWISSHYG